MNFAPIYMYGNYNNALPYDGNTKSYTHDYYNLPSTSNWGMPVFAGVNTMGSLGVNNTDALRVTARKPGAGGRRPHDEYRQTHLTMGVDTRRQQFNLMGDTGYLNGIYYLAEHHERGQFQCSRRHWRGSDVIGARPVRPRDDQRRALVGDSAANWPGRIRLSTIFCSLAAPPATPSITPARPRSTVTSRKPLASGQLQMGQVDRQYVGFEPGRSECRYIWRYLYAGCE